LAFLLHLSYFLQALALTIFQSRNAHHSNYSFVSTDYSTRRVRKSQDFQGHSNSDSRSLKHQPCFQVLSRPRIPV